VRPQWQRPAAHLHVQVAEPSVLQLLGRPEHGCPQTQPARRAARVLERLPAGVRGVRLAPRGTEPLERVGDQIGPHVGHPAQQHEAELPPRQSPHASDPVTMRSC
jgi:hypothetical protein